jgi:hypothetical protein
MKTGIITFHFADNYGAVLQTLALYQKLKEQLGQDAVYIIDYCPAEILKHFSLFYSTGITKNIPVKLCKLLFAVLKLPFYLLKKNKFSAARKKLQYIKTQNIAELDVIVCGSDQIWNPKITGGLDRRYFGIFDGKPVKAVSYAASDGGNLEMEAHETIRKYLGNLSCISVREQSMAERLRNYTVRDITVSIDPVFLPERDFWQGLADEQKCKNYILVYQLEANSQIRKDAHVLSRKTGKRIVEITVNFIDVLKNQHKTLACCGISEFVSLFMYADYVLTNSFHGTAFALLFNKKFFSYTIKESSGRITDLLSGLGIQNRQVSRLPDVFDAEIDYALVNAILESKRKEADIYIYSAIA